MKILIPVLTFHNTGGSRVLSKLANELILLGNEVEFLCPDGSGIPYFPTFAKISWIDKNGNLYQDSNHPDTGEEFFSIQKKLSKALANIPKGSYDAIFANHSLTIMPIVKNGLVAKTLYYVQAYEPDYYKLQGGLKNRLLVLLSSRSYRKDLFTVVNADMYKKYKKLNTTKVLYPGLDFDLFFPKPTKSATEKIIIGTVGRKEKFKGTEYILHAFTIIREKYPQAELHVAFGKAVDYDNFSGVYCFQPTGDEALGEYYRSLDYYFCAGFTQLGAFHYPVVEAMRSGVSVITTPYYPASDNNAWITKICDTPDIVRKFEEAYANPLLTQQKTEQALLDTAQFDWKKAGALLNQYFLELTGAGSKKR
jgi:glycosyltransferase involved in cell wall biosynthesis